MSEGAVIRGLYGPIRRSRAFLGFSALEAGPSGSRRPGDATWRCTSMREDKGDKTPSHVTLGLGAQGQVGQPGSSVSERSVENVKSSVVTTQ